MFSHLTGTATELSAPFSHFTCAAAVAAAPARHPHVDGSYPGRFRTSTHGDRPRVIGVVFATDGHGPRTPAPHTPLLCHPPPTLAAPRVRRTWPRLPCARAARGSGGPALPSSAPPSACPARVRPGRGVQPAASGSSCPRARRTSSTWPSPPGGTRAPAPRCARSQRASGRTSLSLWSGGPGALCAPYAVTPCGTRSSTTAYCPATRTCS